MLILMPLLAVDKNKLKKKQVICMHIINHKNSGIIITNEKLMVHYAVTEKTKIYT